MLAQHLTHDRGIDARHRHMDALLRERHGSPDVSLPLLQSMWVRDTIVTDASGSLFGVSNTFVQFIHAPEPGSGALLAIAAGTAALWRSRSRRRPAC
jgi:hypothetical protein